jgi:hypothetical protein
MVRDSHEVILDMEKRQAHIAKYIGYNMPILNFNAITETLHKVFSDSFFKD